jgi:hypothetical protein
MSYLLHYNAHNKQYKNHMQNIMSQYVLGENIYTTPEFILNNGSCQ